MDASPKETRYMITATTKVHVPALKGTEVTDFFLHAGDAEYQQWWPGTHLHYRTVRRAPGDIGSVVYFDEYIGSRRLKMTGVLLEAVPGERLVLQMTVMGLRLPVALVIEAHDDADGVDIEHTIRAGFAGPGRVLDPLFQLYLSPTFRKALDEHATTEFNRLGRMLHPQAA